MQVASCKLQNEHTDGSPPGRTGASRSPSGNLQFAIPRFRWHILRALLHKEVLRLLANRGAIALALLLFVAALLLSFFGNRAGSPASVLTGGARKCYIDYWDENSPWIRHLQQHVPADLRDIVEFRPPARIQTVRGQIYYPPGVGAIQIRIISEGPPRRYEVDVWYPGEDSSGMAPFESWFWEETNRYFRGGEAPVVKRLQLYGAGGMGGIQSLLAMILIVFALFFICVYLLPSLSCEERERGVLLAQALSPASPLEILGAKFLFYPVIGMALAMLLAAIYKVAVFGSLFFWLALAVSAFGSLSVGLTIATLAKTQRAASMGSLCYLLAVALLLFICEQNGILGLPYLFLEYHTPRMLRAALAGNVQWFHWGNLAATAALGVCWAGLAVALFRRRGWQ